MDCLIKCTNQDWICFQQKTNNMKILVIGKKGYLGSQVVRNLEDMGHWVVWATTGTGIGRQAEQHLLEGLQNCQAIVDLTQPHQTHMDGFPWDFEAWTKALLQAAMKACIGHYVALSHVGLDSLQQSAFFRAKRIQENLIQESGVPYTIVRATPIMEYLRELVAQANFETSIRVSNARVRPIAAIDVALFVSRRALAAPVNRIDEIAGPEPLGLAIMLIRYLEASGNPVNVVVDPEAPYRGATLEEHSLMPTGTPYTAYLTLGDWIKRTIYQKQRNGLQNWLSPIKNTLTYIKLIRKFNLKQTTI